MDDIYNESNGIGDVMEDIVLGAVILDQIKDMNSGPGADSEANNTAGWNKLGRRSKEGFIAKIVRLNTWLYIAVSIGILIFLGIKELLN